MTAASPSTTGLSRTRVLAFGVLTGTLSAGYGVMFTVLDDYRENYAIAAGWLGLVVGAGFLASFLSQIFLAPIADRGHARQLVMLGLAVDCIGLIGMAYGTRLAVLLPARLLMGFGMGMAFPAVRRIVINADPANLGANLGLLLSADVAGFAVGPVVSALLVTPFGIPAPFLLIAALTAGCFIFVVRVDVAARSTTPAEAPSARFAFDLLRNRGIAAGMMLGAAVYLMIGTFDAMWAVVLDDLHASELLANVGITVFALPLIFLGSVGGRLAQRIGPFRWGPLGLLIGSVYMFLYGVLPTAIAMVAVAVIHSLSDGLTVSSSAVGVGMAAPSERQAGAQGMLGAAETLTGFLTATLAGVLYEIGGRGLAFTVCAVVMALLAVGAYFVAGDLRSARPNAAGKVTNASL